MKKHLRNKFLAGVLAAVPIAVTALVILAVERQTRLLFHIDIPFVGVAIALVAIYLLGLLVTSLVGKWLLSLVDRMLSKVPGLSELYAAWKQVTLASGGGEGIFAKVVLVRDASGMLTIGFSSVQPIPGDERTTCVFIPAAPNPTSGRLHFVPLAECRVLDVSSEEAFKMILSGGNYIPDGIGPATR